MRLFSHSFMKRRTKIIILSFLLTILFLFLPVNFLFAQTQTKEISKIIPTDDSIITGTLDNGLTYYIRHNETPEDRVEMRLAVKVGSILENDDQRGLAHFLEHMAFNGTKSFEKNKLIQYLQSLGAEFGPDLNAYTSFDETVYRLNIPTTEQNDVVKGLQILEEWGFQLLLDETEIDKERGVIVEEWRQGRDAFRRMKDQAFPDIFHGSKYAQRLPIGLMDIVKNFSYDTLKDFYKDWYRPELMAVIVVGDIDPVEIEKEIKQRFSPYKNPIDAPQRKQFEVPDNQETIYSLQSDPESEYTVAQIYTGFRPNKMKYRSDLKKGIIQRLYLKMINARFEELVQSTANPPFSQGSASVYEYTPAKSFHTISLVTAPNALDSGFEFLMLELEKIRQHGFTQTELERARKEILASEEQFYNQRESLQSGQWINYILDCYLKNEPTVSFDYDRDALLEYIPEITVEDIHRFFLRHNTRNNRVIVTFQPRKKGVKLITQADLNYDYRLAIITPQDLYKVGSSTTAFFTKQLTPGSITMRSYEKEINLHTWKLSNGATVLIKPTDFKKDEILFLASSPGGKSLIEEKDLFSAEVASDLVAEGGLGDFSGIEVNRLMRVNNFSISTEFRQLTEEITGSSSQKGLEVFLQSIHLLFTDPRKDEKVWTSYLNRLKDYLITEKNEPKNRFYNAFRASLYNNNPRIKPLDIDTFNNIDSDRSLELFKERFSNGGDFTYIFVGDVNLIELENYVLKYIATIPSQGEPESWVDQKIDYTSGGEKGAYYGGSEPLSIVTLAYTGDFDWSYYETYRMKLLSSTLQMKLEERVREMEGGTYSLSVSANPTKYPTSDYVFIIHFYCAPENVEKLVGIVKEEISGFKENVAQRYFDDTVANNKLNFQKGIKENNYWLNNLRYFGFNGIDPSLIIRKPEILYDLVSNEDIRETAMLYLNEKNCTEFVLYPEDWK